jgi:hypothetical protein
MAAIIQLVQSGRMPRTVRAREQIETLATDATPRAVRATEQIETLVTDAIILIRPTSINALGVYCDPGLRLAALRAARDALNRAISEHLQTHWPSESDYETVSKGTTKS